MTTVETKRRRDFPARLTTETRPGYRTTEFWLTIAVILGVLIAAWVIGEGDSGDENKDLLNAGRAWLLVVIAAAAYAIGRGLAKSGSRERYWDDPDDRPTTTRK